MAIIWVIKFSGKNDAGQTVNYAKVTGKISDATDTTEDGLIEIATVKAGSQNIGYRLTSTDLKLINGTGLEVDGNVGITIPALRRNLMLLVRLLLQRLRLPRSLYRCRWFTGSGFGDECSKQPAG